MNKTRETLLILTMWFSATLPVFGQTPEPGPSATPAPVADSASPGGRRAREFQGDDLGQVLRLLARQAKISLLVDESIKGTLNVRFENATAMEAIEAIAHQHKLTMTKDDKGIYYLSPPDESAALLDLLAKPETAARVAAFKRHLYETLKQQGLSPDEASRLMYDTDLASVLAVLAKKPETAAAK